MRERQLPDFRYARQIWWLSSIKNKNRQWCDSLLERDYLLSMEFDDEILGYRSQPISLVYENNEGELRRYTPDAYIKTSAGGYLKEVKVRKYIDDETQHTLNLVNKDIHHRLGTTVTFVCDDEIRIGKRIQNLSLLYSYKRINEEKCYDSPLLNEIDNRIRFRELILLAEKMKQPKSLPLTLVAHGLLTFDTTELLNLSTTLENNIEKTK